MWRPLAQRLSSTVLTLFMVSVLVFFALRLAPGGPFDTDRVLPPEIMAAIAAKYHLDDSLWTQFWSWFSGALHGDFKESFQYLGTPVSEMIWESLPISMVTGGISLVLAMVLGLVLGCSAAWKRGTWWDTSAMWLAISGVNLPAYLMASALILIFSTWLNLLPPALYEGPVSLVLPILTLSLRPIAIVARLTRSAMMEALSADYIRTAYGKGLSEGTVVFKHALRNSMIPIVALLGPIAANLITGSFVVETVFQIPGLGRYFVSAVLNRDYPLVMGVTMVYGAILLLCNFASEVATTWVDPRMRYQ